MARRWSSLRASTAVLQAVFTCETNHSVYPVVSFRPGRTLVDPLPLSSLQCSNSTNQTSYGQRHHWYIQKLFMSTPRIKLKKDSALDSVAEREKHLRPVLKIRDIFLKKKTDNIPVRFLTVKKSELGLKSPLRKVQTFLKRYPTIFVLYVHPKERMPWCRLTSQMMELAEEEKRIHSEQEAIVVEKLRKLLMMSTDRRIRVDKLEHVRRDFGFPDDFLTGTIPKYPEFFRLLDSEKSPYQVLELVAWDESLAVSELEKKVRENARAMGVDEVETRGQPLAFRFSYPPGMVLKKKILENLAKWQKVPYISPYQDANLVSSGTPEAEKRTVALLHELLSLTIEKKTVLESIGRFRTEYKLPQKYPKLFNRFPGIFYTSLKGAIRTIILRDGYNNSKLIEQHPLVNLKEKCAKLIADGPALRSSLRRAREEKKEEVEEIVTSEDSEEENDDKGEEAGEFGGHSEASEGDDENGFDYYDDDTESDTDDDEERHAPSKASQRG